MKSKYLIIATVGDNSLHREWISGQAEFDLFLIYYGTNDLVEKDYISHSQYFLKDSGVSKYIKVKKAIEKNPHFLNQYSHIWLPDDDISATTEDINRLFRIANTCNLLLCQPSIIGHVNIQLTKNVPGKFLRYTCFVEVMAPLFEKNCLMKLKDTFDKNTSSWGIEYLWMYLLKFPRRKVAIIDNVVVNHTRPVGTDYQRFPVHPQVEADHLLKPYKNRLRLFTILFMLKTFNIKYLTGMLARFFSRL